LMYMAENDMEGLQNAVIDTAKSAVMFNEETGKFKITGVEMRRLREQASALGMDYEDLANTAVKAAKEQKVLGELDYTGLDDQTKQLVANLAEVGAGGDISLNIPGIGEIKDLSVLADKQSEEYKALQQSVDDRDKSMKEISEVQVSLARKRGQILEQIRNAVILQSGAGLGSRKGQEGKDIFNLFEANIKATNKDLVESFQKLTKTNAGEIVKGLGGAIVGDFEQVKTSFDTLKSSVTVFSKTAVVNFGKSIKEFTKDNKTFKDSVFTFDKILSGIPLLSGNTTSGSMGGPVEEAEDAIIGPGNNKVLTFPEGALSFNNMDTIFAMTNPMGNNNNNQTPNTTPINSELRINGNIRVDGLRGDTLGEILMNDPGFVARIKDIITTSPNSSNQQYG